jgi:DNA polymerase III epsilon subunit-like protein
MKLDQKQKDYIVSMKKMGAGSRWIATQLGCSKSTVNDVYNAWSVLNKETTVAKKKTLDILYLDLETSCDVVGTFGRYNVNLSESNIIAQGNQIISAAWVFNDDENVSVASSKFEAFKLDMQSERELLLILIDQLNNADAVVIHNARFDLGTIQQRMLAHGLGRMPNVKVIDTLMIAKKYLKLRSNKLDSITKYFGLSNKIENSGIKLWIEVQAGNTAALEEMLEYNAGDVVALRDVYKKFVPLGSSINQGLLTDHDGHVCSNCGSHNVSKTGRLVHTTVSSFEEFECSDCGSKLRGRVNTLSKEKRQNLLVAV